MAKATGEIIISKVYGVNYGDRQRIIKEYCHAGKRVKLIVDRDAKWDLDSIGVWVEKGGIFSNKRYLIGYVKKDIAKDLRRWISERKKVRAKIKNLEVGATEEIPTNVFIEIKISY